MPENKNEKTYIILGAIIIAIAIIFNTLVVDIAVIDPEQLTTVVLITNETGKINGIIPVTIEESSDVPADLFFTKVNHTTFLSQKTVIDTHNITVNNSINCSTGDYLGIFEPSPDNRVYFGEISSVSNNNISIDTPLDFNYSSGAIVTCGNRELNINGLTQPHPMFSIKAAEGNSTRIIEVHRIVLQMTCSSQPDFNKFCDINNGLNRGIVLRKTNEENLNIWNIKTNKDIAGLAYDFQTYSTSNPAQGIFGLSARITYGGQEKHGVTIRLTGEEELQLIIQDDLTSLDGFRIVAQGHVVQD